jgi:nucleoside-diphosphate-sugar epimerase
MLMHWEAKQVLLTGGAGFIGSHSGRILVKKGDFVRAADNLSKRRTGNTSAIHNQIKFRMADLIKEKDCFSYCKKIDIVFRLATSVGDVEYLKKANVGGCLRSILMKSHMLEASLRYDVEHFLFTISTRMYDVYCEGQETSVNLKEESAHPKFLIQLMNGRSVN